MNPIKNTQVAQVFASYPIKFRRKLMALRHLIHQTAKATPGVGKIEETLKWNEPAYLTPETGSGSTIRLAWKKNQPTRYAMCFHCQTNLVETFRNRFEDALKFEGNRSVFLIENESLPVEALSWCIRKALTYHLKN